MLYIWIKATRAPATRSAHERRAAAPSSSPLLRDLVPPLVIFGIVMGSLYLGIATATESAALGVVAALLLRLGSRKLSWTLLQQLLPVRPRAPPA